MTPKRRKPTRRDLLVVIDRVRGIIGTADARNNDRNPNRYADVRGALGEAMQLCMDVSGEDPPMSPSGPWAATEPEPKRYT